MTAATDSSWPRPSHHLHTEPHFLFILTLPYSGSTALAKVLNTASRSTLLHQRGEGQWLVPGMSTEDRWDPDKYIDWESVRAVWMRRVQFISDLAGDIELVIEKSPPNLVRADQLLAAFPRHSTAWLNRNPYAAISSQLHRRYSPENGPEQREAAVRELAQHWLTRSELLLRWRDDHGTTGCSYEALCGDPRREIGRLMALHPALADVHTDVSVSVKDHAPSTLTNHNARQIGLLSPAEVDAVREVLESNPGVVGSFGYGTEVTAGPDS